MYALAIIIDDDPISILVCETLLKKTNFAEKVISFKSGEEALAYFREHYNDGGPIPDYIFLDVIMPVMSGWDFLNAYQLLDTLPERKPHILMLSAAFDPAEKKRAAEAEMVIDFIAKPITKDFLLNLIESKP